MRAPASTVLASLLPVALLVFCPESAMAGTNAAGKAFLKENAGKPGVVVLPSGLQYKVLKKGSGAYHPTDHAADGGGRPVGGVHSK